MSRREKTRFTAAAAGPLLVSPPRLLEANDAIADFPAAALAAANRHWRTDASEEARAWYALQRRRAPAARRRGWRPGGFALAAAALAVIVVLALRRGPWPNDVARRALPAPAAAPSLSSPPIVALRLPPSAGGGGDITTRDAPASERPSETGGVGRGVPLRGEVIAANGVRARLARQGIATLLPESAGTAAIALERGRLEIDAESGPPTPPHESSSGSAPADGAMFAVRAASLRILGERGRFRVDTDGARVGVSVQSGEVRIYSSRRLVARVIAGQHWSFAPRLAATNARAPGLEPDRGVAPAPASAAPDRDCLRHARDGATDRAIACFQEQSGSTGLSAEVALLEIARLRRDVSGDLGGAERALDEYRRRFPRGTLSTEAGIARVELLLRLGRPDDALVEARALPEGEGDFWRAVCLAKLGRRDEARGAFDGYLARPDAARRREAQRRRAELAR